MPLSECWFCFGSVAEQRFPCGHVVVVCPRPHGPDGLIADEESPWLSAYLSPAASELLVVAVLSEDPICPVCRLLESGRAA